MTLLNNSHDFTTHAIHAGRHPHSSAVPIYQGINAPIDDGSTKYISEVGAVGGPTVAALATAVSTLESANSCLAVPSGMAAISLTLLALLQRGDRIIAHRCIYTYATHFLNQDLSPKWGVEVVWVDMRNLDELQAALQQPTRLVYFEPIANPAMHLLDVAAIAEHAHAAGAVVAVDNTLLSPYLLQPLALGVDIVLHSATKYLGGHGDAMSGVISGRDETLYTALNWMRMMLGSYLAPMNAYLALRGLRTLPFRMEQHCANTRAVVAFLQTRPEVTSVRYASLADAVPLAQQRGFGALLGFTLAEGLDAETFRRHLQLCRPWGSLGDVETLVATPAANPTRDIPANFVRVAVGLEAPQDIIADLAQAFDLWGVGSGE